MNPQAMPSRLLTIGLLVTSISGTLALFGIVPLLAQRQSPPEQTAQNQTAAPC